MISKKQPKVKTLNDLLKTFTMIPKKPISQEQRDRENKRRREKRAAAKAESIKKEALKEARLAKRRAKYKADKEVEAYSGEEIKW
jgi:hypothetical protein